MPGSGKPLVLCSPPVFIIYRYIDGVSGFKTVGVYCLIYGGMVQIMAAKVFHPSLNLAMQQVGRRPVRILWGSHKWTESELQLLLDEASAENKSWMIDRFRGNLSLKPFFNDLDILDGRNHK